MLHRLYQLHTAAKSKAQGTMHGGGGAIGLLNLNASKSSSANHHLFEVPTHLSQYAIYRVVQKLAYFSYALTSSSIVQFSSLFHC